MKTDGNPILKQILILEQLRIDDFWRE
jgi:hypothetical protein